MCCDNASANQQAEKFMQPHDDAPLASAQGTSAHLGWAKEGYWEDDLMQFAFSSDDSLITDESSMAADQCLATSDF